MVKEYVVEGMTCNGCVSSVKHNLEELSAVNSVEVTLSPPLATIIMDMPVPEAILQSAVGKYKLTEKSTRKLAGKSRGKSTKKSISNQESILSNELQELSISTYKPLILIVGFIAGVSLLSQYPFDSFSWMVWMRYFMAGFFIVFSFFKLLNISGFASSYSMYDVIAARWKGWGYIYPFVELGLGILYLINIAPFFANVTTIIILGIGTIGVIQSNLAKREIKCACLGDVFNLPMSTVTIVEDVTMVVMAVMMLFLV